MIYTTHGLDREALDAALSYLEDADSTVRMNIYKTSKPWPQADIDLSHLDSGSIIEYLGFIFVKEGNVWRYGEWVEAVTLVDKALALLFTKHGGAPTLMRSAVKVPANA